MRSLHVKPYRPQRHTYSLMKRIDNPRQIYDRPGLLAVLPNPYVCHPSNHFTGWQKFHFHILRITSANGCTRFRISRKSNQTEYFFLFRNASGVRQSQLCDSNGPWSPAASSLDSIKIWLKSTCLIVCDDSLERMPLLLMPTDGSDKRRSKLLQ